MKLAAWVILFCLIALFVMWWAYAGLLYAAVGICVVIILCAVLLASAP